MSDSSPPADAPVESGPVESGADETSTPSPSPPGPIESSGRLDSLDLARGVAVLAILLVNINSFGMPSLTFARPWLWGEHSPLDMGVFTLNAILVQNKFYALFAMLFGAGLAIQLARLDARGDAAEATFLRRLAFLFILGLAHAVLLWMGDILNWYAMAGVLVLLMRRLSTRLLMLLVVIFALVPALRGGHVLLGQWMDAGSANAGGFFEEAGESPTESFPASFEIAARHAGLGFGERLEQMMSMTPVGVSLEAQLHAGGGYWEAVAFRGCFYVFMLAVLLLMMIWPILAFMLLGIVLWRVGFFETGRIPGMTGWDALGCGIAGIVISVLGTVLILGEHELAREIGSLLLLYSSFALAPAYLFALVRWSKAPSPGWLTKSLSACGRMALSNYLLQSVVMTFVFHSQGLGLMGRFSYAGLLPFAVAMWAVHLVISPWWLARFHQGPVEWIWRCVTYGRAVEFRKWQRVAM